MGVGGGEGGGGVTSSCPLCLQIKSLWALCPLFLQACLLATMTRPRTATSLDTMTCLRYGILHHLHLGARTAEESAWDGIVPVDPAGSRDWTSRP